MESSLRALARTYSEGRIDEGEYRVKRARLLDEITIGGKPIEYENLESAFVSTGNDSMSSSTVTEREPIIFKPVYKRPETKGGDWKKMAVLGVLTIVLIASGLIFTLGRGNNPPIISAPQAKVSRVPAASKTISPAEKITGNMLITGFLDSIDWTPAGIDRFEKEWKDLSAKDRIRARQSSNFKVMGIRLREHWGEASDWNPEDIDNLQLFAKRIGLDTGPLESGAHVAQVPRMVQTGETRISSEETTDGVEGTQLLPKMGQEVVISSTTPDTGYLNEPAAWQKSDEVLNGEKAAATGIEISETDEPDADKIAAQNSLADKLRQVEIDDDVPLTSMEKAELNGQGLKGILELEDSTVVSPVIAAVPVSGEKDAGKSDVTRVENITIVDAQKRSNAQAEPPGQYKAPEVKKVNQAVSGKKNKSVKKAEIVKKFRELKQKKKETETPVAKSVIIPVNEMKKTQGKGGEQSGMPFSSQTQTIQELVKIDNQWLMEQNPDHWCIQLGVFLDPGFYKKFKPHREKYPVKFVTYLRKERNGVRVIYGLYTSEAEALEQRKKMPPEVYKIGNDRGKPKKIKKIQLDVKKE